MLADSRGMAGTDPSGTTWATQYDEGAIRAVSGLQAMVNANLQRSGLLEQTGFNHAAADSASTAGLRTDPGHDCVRVPDRVGPGGYPDAGLTRDR
ncbi:MAG: hypothetical protein ABI301_04930 [Jatrophihabitantaceae bacterium]